MSQYRCDTCGKRFNSQYNLELHQDLRDCEPPETTTDNSEETKEKRTLQNRDRLHAIEGTVSTYDKDGGYGFLTTADLEGQLEMETEQTQDVFFHISEAATGWVEEGDRLRCDVVEGDRGLECTSIEVIIRDRQRKSYDKPSDRPKEPGFGSQKDNSQYGAGTKSSPTESDIEDFQDERKFR